MGWSKISRHQRGYGTAHDKMRALLAHRDRPLAVPVGLA